LAGCRLCSLGTLVLAALLNVHSVEDDFADFGIFHADKLLNTLTLGS